MSLLRLLEQTPRTGLTQQTLTVPSPGGRSPRCRHGQGRSSRGLSPRVWMAVLSLGPHGVVPPRVCVLIPSSCKDPGHMGSGPPR